MSRLSAQNDPSGITNTRILWSTVRKLEMVAAFDGTDRLETLDRVLNEALSSRKLPLPPEHDSPEPGPTASDRTTV